VVVAILLLIVAAVRLHELVSVLRFVKPALLVTFGGGGLLWLRSSSRARSALLRHPLFRLVVAYWVFMLVTMPFALWPGLAAGSVQYFVPAVALVAALLLCRPELRTLSTLQLAFVLAAAAFAINAKLFGRVFADGRLEPVLGMYDSNDMASLLGLTFPMAVGLYRSERGGVRYVAAGAAVILLTVVMASGSRGGMLGLVAGATVYVLGMRGSRRITALALLAVVAAGLWSFSPSFKNRMSTLTNLEDDYNTYHEYGRKAVWKRGRQYMRDNPVIGVGAGNFPIAEGEYFGLTYAGSRGAKWSNAHNAYVQAFAELGVIGGSIFVAILLYGVRQSYRPWRGLRLRTGEWMHRPELLASLCAFMVSAIFLSHAYFMPMVATVGMIALADRVRALGMRAPPVVVTQTALPGQGMASAAQARPPAAYRFRGGLAR
jgi:O-antigen ligase